PGPRPRRLDRAPGRHPRQDLGGDRSRYRHADAAQPQPRSAGPARGPANRPPLNVVGFPRRGIVRASLALLAAVLLIATASPALASAPTVDAKAWVLIDPRDDSVLASKAPNRRLEVASTTKLMTAYLALKHLEPNQMITAPNYHP